MTPEKRRTTTNMIREALDDERLTLPILVAALGVLEAVSDTTAAIHDGDDENAPDFVDLTETYDQGRALGAKLPGGIDHRQGRSDTDDTTARFLRWRDSQPPLPRR